MIYNDLNKLILDAMRSKDNDRVNILRLIKNELVRKEKDGVTINDSVEATVLNKMVSQREDSIEQFTKANRMDLVEKETIELNLLKEYAPKATSIEDIEVEVKNIINSFGEGYVLSMKDMKTVMNGVKSVYPTANSKDISDAVCGSIFEASKHAEEFAYDYGESLEQTITANTSSDSKTSEQIALDFELEMQKLLDPVTTTVQKNKAQPENNVLSSDTTRNTNMPNTFIFDNMIIW